MNFVRVIRGRNPSYCGLLPKPRGHIIKNCAACQRKRAAYWRAVRAQSAAAVRSNNNRGIV